MASNQFQRNSRQRQVILEELRKLASHPTAAVLYAVVRRRLPKISLGTVYRNLELLARLGVVQKLEFAGGEARFDGKIARHDHVRCVRCGRLDDVSAPPLDLLEGAANDWGGYQILGHRLEFFGICPQCRGRTNDGGPHGSDTAGLEVELPPQPATPATRTPVTPTVSTKPC